MQAAEVLARGRVFPSVDLDVGPSAVAAYRRATGDEATPSHLVPPAAILAFSLAPLLEDLQLLKGAVHTGQEMEALRVVAIGERLSATVTVANASQRSGSLFAVIEEVVHDQSGAVVLRGRSNVVLGEAEAAS
jgi:acyl dehydratase